MSSPINDVDVIELIVVTAPHVISVEVDAGVPEVAVTPIIDNAMFTTSALVTLVVGLQVDPEPITIFVVSD